LARLSENTQANVVPGNPTAEEMRTWYKNNYQRIMNFAKAEDNFLKARNIAKNQTKTIRTFDKITLQSYLENIGSNERNLRNLSWYLFYRSQVYKRLITYNATMFCLYARSVIPKYSLVEKNNDKEILQSYYDTLVTLDNMHIQREFLKIYMTCFTQDVFYGCVYYDETGMFILPLPPDYCKIAGFYQTGDFAFAMDMTYFRSNNDLLEYWGEPFQSMYKIYEKEGNNGRWQIMPDEYAVCLKANAEDWQVVVPPFSGLFNQLINLEDLVDVQAVADEQEIYKMVYLEMETLQGAKNSDQWAVDPTISLEYFDRMVDEALPDYTSAAVVPGKLNTISFDTDKATETNKVEKATETVLNTSGGAQILNSASISGTTAFTAAIMADTQIAISSLLGQTEAWVNRFISYQVSDPSYVKFFEVSEYTKETYRKQLLENGQHGLPTKLAINSLSGYSELETLSLNYLEENILKLPDKFKNPLRTSYTQGSGYTTNRTGRRRVDDGELTDDGEASREKSDRSNG
jgi:hypothetical protein